MKGLKGKVIGLIYGFCTVATGVLDVLGLIQASDPQYMLGLSLIAIAAYCGLAIMFQIIPIIWLSILEFIKEERKGEYITVIILLGFGWFFQIIYALGLLYYTGPFYELPLMLPLLITIFTLFMILFGILTLYFTLRGKSPEEGKPEVR